MAKIKSKNKAKILTSPFKDYWNKQNYILFALGLLIIVGGFILMAQDPWNNSISLTISPIVLLVAYIIVIPLSILYKKKNPTLKEDVSSKN